MSNENNRVFPKLQVKRRFTIHFFLQLASDAFVGVLANKLSFVGVPANKQRLRQQTDHKLQQ